LQATSRADELKQSLDSAKAELETAKREVLTARTRQDERVTAMQKTHKKFYDRQSEELAKVSNGALRDARGLFYRACCRILTVVFKRKANVQVADMTRKLDVARGEARRFCAQISGLREEFDKKVADLEAQHKAKLSEIEANQRTALEERNAEINAVRIIVRMYVDIAFRYSHCCWYTDKKCFTRDL
jgi:hypothetical protein